MNEEKILELLYQIDREIYQLERKYADLEDEVGTSKANKLVAKRKKESFQEAKRIIQEYQTKLSRGVWLSECCDAELRYYPMHRSECSECGEDDPDTYNVEKSVEDLIEDVEQ